MHIATVFITLYGMVVPQVGVTHHPQIAPDGQSFRWKVCRLRCVHAQMIERLL